MSKYGTPRKLTDDELRAIVDDRLEQRFDRSAERTNERDPAPVATGVAGRAEQRRDAARDRYGQLPQNARDDDRPRPRTNSTLERRARRRRRFDPDKEPDEDAVSALTNDDGGGRRTRSYRSQILKTKDRLAKNGDDDR